MSIRASIANFIMKHMVKRTLARVTDIESMQSRFGATPINDTVPEGYALESEDISGISCEWISGPDSRDDRVILYLHGGGYVVGSPSAYRDLAARLCSETGMRVLVPDYRLAPAHPFPAAVEDASTIYRYLLSAGISPDALAVAGDSAGGGLTVALLSAMRSEGLPMPAACALISPWTDLTLSGPSVQTNERADPMLTPTILNVCAKAYVGDRDASAPLASPLFADHRGFPATLIHVGSTEILLSDATRLRDRMQVSGVDVALEEWPKMAHVFHLFGKRMPEALEATSKLGQFMKRRVEAAIRNRPSTEPVVTPTDSKAEGGSAPG
ncbi:MAG: alpha/beta hydrolase [Pseudomonadota bacterium]